MKLAIPTLMSRLNEERRVECDGFYDGAHGSPIERGIEEIEGKFEEKKANLQRDAVTNQKRLEAEIKHLDEVGPAVERKVQAVEEKNGEQQLSIVLPVVVVILALFAIISEALLLAPAMDILNVTNEIAQLFTAFGLAAVAGLTFHFVWESFISEAFPNIWKVTIRVVAAMLAFGLVVWGILRGFQVAFAAYLNQNPLGDFLSGHPILSSIFFVFITLATPVIAATATHYGAHRMQGWWEWKTAKRKFEALSKRRAQAVKELEAQEKALQLGLKALAEERMQWKSVYSKQKERRHIVILPDVSGSIEPSALEQAFKAIDELSGSLRRGDKIAIIPILGDAEAEASGRIIRFEMPMNRQAYDSDLRDFRVKLRSALQQMEARADAHPGA